MIKFDCSQIFHEIESFHSDLELQDAVAKCIRAQKRLGQEKYEQYFQQRPDAAEAVSKESLDEIRSKGEDVSDIRTHKDLSNCIVFHTRNLDGSCIDERILELRKEADALVSQRIWSLFGRDLDLNIECSGHFWYPPGGFMGWHTNLRKPGWRLYVNYAEQPGKSFFRYRDPDTGQIHTAIDKQWNFRLFKICHEKPFWHAVYADADRYSLGYMINLK